MIITLICFHRMVHQLPKLIIFFKKLEEFDYVEYFNSTLGSRRRKRSETDYNHYHDYDFLMNPTTNNYEYDSNETVAITTATGYQQVFEKIERLLNSIEDIFKRDYVDGDDHHDCCIHLENLASALGELKDGPIYSLPKIIAADLLTEAELNMMENTMHQCNVASCGLFKREIDVTKDLVDELEEYLKIKKFDDDKKYIFDAICSFGEFENHCKL